MSRSYRILSALLLVAMLAACNPAPRTDAAKGSSVAPKAETSGVTAEKNSMDIGDVESVLHIVATLAARSAGPCSLLKTQWGGPKKAKRSSWCAKKHLPKTLTACIRPRQF